MEWTGTRSDENWDNTCFVALALIERHSETGQKNSVMTREDPAQRQAFEDDMKALGLWDPAAYGTHLFLEMS